MFMEELGRMRQGTGKGAEHIILGLLKQTTKPKIPHL